MTKTRIREIFLSIQGEGPHIGEEHLFIRFCGCNLRCAYCDTDFEISKSKEYTPQKLIQEVNNYGKTLTLSLTGGEPLVSAVFLKEFLPLAKAAGHKIYLETNATLPEKLQEIISYIDIVSADIKLPSAAGEEIPEEIFDEFFSIASSKELFAKIVFNSQITEEEILSAVRLAKRYDFEIILRPQMQGNNFTVSKEEIEHTFKVFCSNYRKVRLIPQVHKFLDVR